MKGSLVANDSEVIRQVYLDGTGLMLMQTWLIGGGIRGGRLRAVLTDFQVHPQADMDMGIYTLYLPYRKHSLRGKTFIDFLMKRLGNPPYWDAISLRRLFGILGLTLAIALQFMSFCLCEMLAGKRSHYRARVYKDAIVALFEPNVPGELIFNCIKR